MPVKSVAGVNTTFVPLMFAVPFVGLTETIVNASPSGSESFTKTGTVTAIFFGVLPASSTASGGRLVMLVTTGGLVLFVGVGSIVGPPTVAMFVTAPRVTALTVSVRLVVAFSASVPRFVQITWLAAFVVTSGTELTKIIPAGKLSVTAKFAAVDGPRFVTEIWYWKLTPSALLAAPDLPTARSAIVVTIVTTGGVTLFVGIGSGVGEPRLATFVSEPLVGAVTVTVRLLVAPFASVPRFHVTRFPFVVPLPLALTNVTFAGSESVTMTPVAVDGPLFVTLRL